MFLYYQFKSKELGSTSILKQFEHQGKSLHAIDALSVSGYGFSYWLVSSLCGGALERKFSLAFRDVQSWKLPIVWHLV